MSNFFKLHPFSRVIAMTLVCFVQTGPLQAEVPDPGLYQGAPALQTATPDWSGAEWISGGDPNQYACLRTEFSVTGDPSNAVLHLHGGLRHRVYLNGVFVGADNREDEELLSRSYDVSAFLAPGDNVLAIVKYATGPDDKGLLAKLEVAGEVMAVSDASWKSLVPDKAWQDTGLRVSRLSPMEVFDPAKAPPEAWMQSGFDDSQWSPVSTLNGMPTPQVDPRPQGSRSFVAPANLVWVGESIRLDEHERLPRIALYKAYEPMQAFEFSEISDPETLLDPESGFLEADLIYPLSSSGMRSAIQDGHPPAYVSPTVVLDFGRVIEGYFFVEIESDAAGPTLDLGFSRHAVGNRVLVLPHESGKDPAQGNQAHRLILPKGRIIWQGFHTEPTRYVNLSIRNLGNSKVKIHTFGLIQTESAPMTGGATVISRR